MFALLGNALPFERDFSWLRPPDFSGRAWWVVSVEAKLLLQTVLEAEVTERATLDAMRESAWFVHGPPPAHAAHEKARPTLGRQGYGSMMQLGRVPKPVGAHVSTADVGSASLTSVSAFAAAACAGKPEPEAELAASPLDVPPTCSQREVMDSGEGMDTGSQRELMEADAAMQTEAAQKNCGNGSASGSPLTLRRCGSPGGLCIASELASVSLRCSSDGAAESGGATESSGEGRRG